MIKLRGCYWNLPKNLYHHFLATVVKLYQSLPKFSSFMLGYILAYETSHQSSYIVTTNLLVWWSIKSASFWWCAFQINQACIYNVCTLAHGPQFPFQCFNWDVISLVSFIISLISYTHTHTHNCCKLLTFPSIGLVPWLNIFSWNSILVELILVVLGVKRLVSLMGCAT